MSTTTLLAAYETDAPREAGWCPDPDVDLTDGDGLHELLYRRGDLRRPRPWCAAPTEFIVRRAVDELEDRLERLEPGGTIRVLDYGTGTGLAAIELLKALRERDFEARLDRCDGSLELNLADIPSSWFARGYTLLRDCAWTRFHAVTDGDGNFRELPEVMDGRRMDLVTASMVFHLVPARALDRVANGLADIMEPGARLLWNAPDLAPAGPRAVLFHDPNREVRARWKQLLEGEAEPATEIQRGAVAVGRRKLEARDGQPADERADKRILPDANEATDVAATFDRYFDGEITGEDHEMTREEVLDTLLVPSNQREYLPEIDDDATRSELIRDLLLDDVLPEMGAGPAGTDLGHNVHWTLGDYRLAAG